MFKYPLHNQILHILQAINNDFFLSCETYFSGGKILVLAYGEYRLSRNINFLHPFLGGVNLNWVENHSR
jgi:hypothetical protein